MLLYRTTTYLSGGRIAQRRVSEDSRQYSGTCTNWLRQYGHRVTLETAEVPEELWTVIREKKS